MFAENYEAQIKRRPEHPREQEWRRLDTSRCRSSAFDLYD